MGEASAPGRSSPAPLSPSASLWNREKFRRKRNRNWWLHLPSAILLPEESSLVERLQPEQIQVTKKKLAASESRAEFVGSPSRSGHGRLGIQCRARRIPSLGVIGGGGGGGSEGGGGGGGSTLAPR